MKHPPIQWATRRPGIIPVFFLSLFLNLNGQNFLPDGRSLALGEIKSVSTGDNILPRNPAMLGYIDKASFSASHALPFLIKDIGISSLEMTLPVFPGAFHFKIASYGLPGYRNNYSGLSYGLKIRDKLATGISIIYYNTIASGEWSYLWTIGIGAGCSYNISEKTSLAVLLSNPLTIGNYYKSGPLFPSALSLGILHEIYENTFLMTEFSGYSDGRFRIKTALEYQFLKAVSLRCGYHSTPQTFSFGTGLSKGKFKTDFGFAWSALPGICPALSLTYIPKF